MAGDKDYHPSLDDPNAWVPYRYQLSKPAAIVFVVLFALTTAVHLFQLFKKRTWYFIPLIVGGFFEVGGYVGRIISHKDIWALNPFIVQAILLLVAPALFAASIYIILGRIILLVDGEKYSLIKQRRLTAIFVTGDVLSFLIQGGGGGIQASKSISAIHTGENLILVGLFLQITFFGFFVVVAGLFHHHLVNRKPSRQVSLRMFSRKGSRRLTASSSSPPDFSSTVDPDTLPWKKHIFALYAASLLIMIRSIFRVVEYIQGNNGYLLKHEIFLYIFDAVLMFLVMVLFNVIHPSEVTEKYHQWKTGTGSSSPDYEMGNTRNQYLAEDSQTAASDRTKGSAV